MTNLMTSVFFIIDKLFLIFLLSSFDDGVFMSMTISISAGMILISSNPLVSIETL